MSTEHFLSRRDFGKKSLQLTAAIVIAQAIPDTRQLPVVDTVSQQPIKFPLGTSGDYEKSDWFKLDRQQTYATQIQAPFERVRVAVRMSDVVKTNGSYDFSIPDSMVQKALANGKAIDLQLGAQTYGFKEVNVPGFLIRRFPYLEYHGIVLDTDVEFRKVVMDYIDASADTFFKLPQIETIHVGNEALSEHLEVNLGRHTSVEFLLEQNERVRKLDPFKRPLVQNLPWDTPQAAIWLLKDSDIEIMALNIYNNTTLQPLLWKWVEEMHRLCSFSGKKFAVSEYQAAPWIDEHKQLVYDYSTEEFKTGLRRLMPFNVEFFHLYDWQQLLWRAGNNEPEFHDQYSYVVNGEFSK